jgi:hypothetical protein
MACLRSYLERTANLQSSLNNSGVFIGSNKPHNPVTGSTLGRWMKDENVAKGSWHRHIYLLGSFH